MLYCSILLQILSDKNLIYFGAIVGALNLVFVALITFFLLNGKNKSNISYKKILR